MKPEQIATFDDLAPLEPIHVTSGGVDLVVV